MSLSQSQPSLRLPNLPSPVRQLSYFSTGCLAGFASLPMAFYPTIPSFTAATTTTLRAGIRFWTFDAIRHLTAPFSLPVSLTGALGGASGGFMEVLVHSLVQSRQLPSAKALGSQSLKLFFCFGTYTFLSTSLTGATGSGIVAALEGVRGRALWMGAVPRGAATIGTVIAVQVTSCAGLLDVLQARGLHEAHDNVS